MRKNIKKHRSIPESRPIEVVQDGKTYRGTWRVEGDSLNIRSDWGFKAAPLGTSDPALLARHLLQEMLQEQASQSGRSEAAASAE